MGPQNVVSGFIHSYTLQLGLSRVYWDYISFGTTGTVFCFGGLIWKGTCLVLVFGKRFCWGFLFKSCFTDITGKLPRHKAMKRGEVGFTMDHSMGIYTPQVQHGT